MCVCVSDVKEKRDSSKKFVGGWVELVWGVLLLRKVGWAVSFQIFMFWR